jgi:uncharacterized C2H2 Zn-finger protein
MPLKQKVKVSAKTKKITKKKISKVPVKKLGSTKKRATGAANVKLQLPCNFCKAVFTTKSAKSRHVKVFHGSGMVAIGRPKTGGKKKKVSTPKAKPKIVTRVRRVQEIYEPGCKVEDPYYYIDYNFNKPDHAYSKEENVREPNTWYLKKVQFIVLIQRGEGQVVSRQFTVPN